MLARPPVKVIYRSPTSIFRPACLTFFTPPKHLYHSTSRGNHVTHLTALKIRPVLVAVLTSTGCRSDQYWLPSWPVLLTRSDQYCSPLRPVLVAFATYIGRWVDLYRFIQRPI